MNSVAPKRQIFLTGAPGSGKTTLVKKVCHELKAKDIPLSGFYTEELRASGRRVGFDIVSVQGTRKPLARTCCATGAPHLAPRVGKYVVDVPSFESLALPALSQQLAGVTIIDEIGKMELYSKHFEVAVQDLMKTDSVIFGTLPLLDGRSHKLVRELHSSPRVQILTVNFGNCDLILKEVLHHLFATVSNK